MNTVVDFNPLASVAIPNVGFVNPRGLIVVIGPNSSGKTQMLKDIEARLLGIPRKSIVCDAIEITRPHTLEPFLDSLYAAGHIKRRTDPNNNIYIDSMTPHLGALRQSHWKSSENQLVQYFRDRQPTDAAEQVDQFMEHFGRFFVSSLFLNRRLVLTDTVPQFDDETDPPNSELQALYMNEAAKDRLTAEAISVFGMALWLDNTLSNRLCLRVSVDGRLPSDKERREPAQMRKYRTIEDEGDGFKSYMATCITLLLGRRPISLIDEPEMSLHPPQAYALALLC
jgi:hypothetical protein